MKLQDDVENSMQVKDESPEEAIYIGIYVKMARE
jgi:hypothetical protein